MNQMFKVKLMNEFMHGVLWVYNEKGIPTPYDLIDNDKTLQAIDEQIEDLYDSYYEFDSHDAPCWFNDEKEKEYKQEMLILIAKLKARLSEINDGSFAVEDCITDYLVKL